jgi:archaellum biogenesis ATPase FlaH
LIKSFDAFNIGHVPHSLSSNVDLLDNVASKLIPFEKLLLDTFSMELLYRTSILDNLTNWRVFYDDEKIIIFLHLEGTFKDSIIDEDQHDGEMDVDVSVSINQSIEKNITNLIKNIFKSVRRLEKLHDL